MAKVTASKPVLVTLEWDSGEELTVDNLREFVKRLDRGRVKGHNKVKVEWEFSGDKEHFKMVVRDEG